MIIELLELGLNSFSSNFFATSKPRPLLLPVINIVFEENNLKENLFIFNI